MATQLAKTKIQNQATIAWAKSSCWGILCMATGTGKSKIFVDQVKRIAAHDKDCVFVIVVPTRKLRDKNWKEEFEKWDALELWETRVISTCYTSLKKLKGLNIGLLGLDECHRMTDRQMVFFESNTINACIGLTATMPNEGSASSMDKQMIFRNLGLKVIFEFTLLEALQQKVVADVEIVVIKLSFDNKTPYLTRSKWERDLVTEQALYDHFSNQIFLLELNGNRSTHALRNSRAAFIKELRSKTRTIKGLLGQLSGRFVIFCSGKLQCAELLGADVYHSSSGDVAFNKFVDGSIDKLGAIAGLNEGHTLPNVDGIFIAHMTSKVRDFVQRLGRAIRYRENFKAKCYIAAIENSIDYEWTIRVLQETRLPFIEVKLNRDHGRNDNKTTTVQSSTGA